LAGQARANGIDLTFGDVERLGDWLLGDVIRLTKARRGYLAPYDPRRPLPENLPPDVRAEAGRAAVLKQVVVNEPAGRIVLPLVIGGRSLGSMVLEGLAPGLVNADVLPYLTRIIDLGLENVFFYKANVTDPLTGLFNRRHLLGQVARFVEEHWDSGGGRVGRQLSWTGGAEGGSFSLLLLGAPGYWTEEHLAAGADELVKILGESVILARDESFGFACLAPGMERAAAEATALGLPRRMADLAVGWLTFPQDCPDLAVVTRDGPAAAAERVFARAWRAMEAAVRRGVPFNFSDVLTGDARVVQVLAGNRVILDVGREAGVEVGRRFIVGGTRRQTAQGSVLAARYPQGTKGELVVVGLEPETAVAEVVAITDPLWVLDKGDEVVPRDDETGDPAATLVEIDAATGLPSLAAFSRRLIDLAADSGGGAVILLKLDGLARLERVGGAEAAAARRRALTGLVKDSLPEGAWAGLYSPDTVAVCLPGADQAAALAWADPLTGGGESADSVTAGVAVYPFLEFDFDDLVDRAVKALDHATLLGPGSLAAFDAVSLNVSGDKLYSQGRQEEARDEFLRALTIDPEEVNVINSLGVCYGQLGRMDQALDCFQRARDLDPDNIMTHFNLGFALAALGRRDEGIAALTRAAELDPEHDDVRLQLGRLLLLEGLAEEAERHLERAAAAARPRPLCWRLLGDIQWRRGDLDQAVALYERAVKAAPLDAESLSGLGALFLERGTDSDVALSLCGQAVELAPDNPTHRYRYGWALLMAGRHEAAAAVLADVVEGGFDQPAGAWRWAQALEAGGQTDQAVSALERALELDPDFEPAADMLRRLTGSD
jgi:tetratricopeptide (TPR) repeat protein